MTFEQFRKSRIHFPDVGKVLPDVVGGASGPVPGFVYLAQLHIEDVTEDWPAAAKAEGKFYLRIANMEWISDDLDALERRLYEYAVDEGMSL